MPIKVRQSGALIHDKNTWSDSQVLNSIHLILFFFAAHHGLGFIIIYYTILQCGSAGPQTALWGGPRPRFEPRPGGLEAGTLTIGLPHLLSVATVFKSE